MNFGAKGQDKIYRDKSGMRKLILLVVLLCLSACGQSAESTWQEQYDLGVRYLSEGNYEEAIIAFTAAIEIDAARNLCASGVPLMFFQVKQRRILKLP